MALSAEDKQRLVELANAGRRGRQATGDAEDHLRLAGQAATPISPHMLRAGRGSGLLGYVGGPGRLALLVGLPLLFLTWGGWYTYRHDLHRLDVGAVFDTGRGLTLRHRFMDQVRTQKEKRRLLDEGQAFGFASDHLAAVNNADRVLAMEPSNLEAQFLRESSFNRQVVYARGAFENGDLDEAITRVQQVLEVVPDHERGQALLRDCVRELVHRSETAFEMREYARAGELVHRAEGILPAFPPALDRHRKLVQFHVKRADAYYVEQRYTDALEDIVSVRRLEEGNTRADALFALIDERIGFPDIAVNSVMTVHGRPRVMATIRGQAAQLEIGGEFGNVRVQHIDRRSGTVIFEQMHTGEQQHLIKVPGTGGTWITADS